MDGTELINSNKRFQVALDEAFDKKQIQLIVKACNKIMEKKKYPHRGIFQ